MSRLSQVVGLFVAMSVSAAPLKSQREVEVQAALAASATSVTVRIAPNRSHVPSVGIMETTASGAGDQWLTTLWQSAFVATQATDSSLLDFEFTLRVGGGIDGPSAGLLTASTLTALIRGKKVLPHTTMTGSVNPDGSAGPVEDVLSRLRAAATAGVKRFGFPLGGRQQVDASGEVTDLLIEGKKLGVEVKELSGLDDAYVFLTGEVLGRPVAVGESDMELWPAELAVLKEMTSAIRNEFMAERPSLEGALETTAPKSAKVWRDFTERSLRQAEDFERSGDLVRAMVVWSSILTFTHLGTQEVALARALDAGDTDAVFAIIKREEEALPVERRNLRRDIDARFPSTTRENDLYAMDLLESVVTQGTALKAETDAKELRAIAPSDPTFGRLVRKYAEGLVRARDELKNGRRFLALFASLPPLKKSLPPIDASRLAVSYAAAGAASRAYFKARLTQLIETDSTYLDLVGYGELLNTETDARARLVLAARQTIYSAYLVNTWYALGAELDAKGAFSIRNPRSLTAQLEQAKLRVLQSCGRAKRQTGSIPFPARLRFLNARAAREGSDLQKTETLADLWISNWWCEFAVRDQK